MGKNVLKSPGVFLGNPSILLRLIIFIIIFLGVMAVNAEDVRMKLLKELNARIPHISQWNISQTEFANKHGEYFDLMERNQRRRLNSSSNYDEENIVRKKLYTFTHSGLKNSPPLTNGVKVLNYQIHIPEEPNKHVEVEETSLRLLIVPRSCATEKQSITLKIVQTDDNYLLKADNFYLDKCLPKWIGLDLNDGFNLNLKSNYNVSIGCEECTSRNIDLEDPHLNVIVNVKSRLRRRRAEKEKNPRRKFPGKCGRHPWEVDLGKLKGYEFIVQPRKFDAGLCGGKCRGHWHWTNQHSHLQLMYSQIDKTIPRPCCSPSKLENLEILYPDAGNPKKLKVSVWKGTKIVECACS